MSDKLIHNSAHDSLNCGTILFILNGAPFFVYVPLLNILGLFLRIPLFLLSKTMLTLLTMTFTFLSILYEIHIGNFIWLKPPNVGKIAQDRDNQLMLPLPEPATSHLKTLFTPSICVMSLLDPLIIPTVFTNLILFLALYAPIVTHAMKLLNTSFGIALGGILCARNILPFSTF